MKWMARVDTPSFSHRLAGGYCFCEVFNRGKIKCPAASGGLNGIPRKAVIFDDPSPDQVLLNNALQHFGRRGVIPDAFRIHDGDGAAFADAQTVGLGAVHAVE